MSERIFTFKGLIHKCKNKEKMIFYDIEIDDKCRFCGENLTKYQETEFEIRGIKTWIK